MMTLRDLISKVISTKGALGTTSSHLVRTSFRQSVSQFLSACHICPELSQELLKIYNQNSYIDRRIGGSAAHIAHTSYFLYIYRVGIFPI